MGGQILPFGVLVKFVMFGDGLDGLQEIGRFALAPRGQSTVINFQVSVRHHQPLVKKQLHPQTVTGGASPERRVERKQPRLDLGDGETTDRAGKIFAKGQAFGFAGLIIAPAARNRRGFQNGDAIGQIQRGAKTVGQPRFQPFAHHDPVHHHVDIVAEFLVQRGRFVQFIKLPVYLDPLKPLFTKFNKFFAIFTFAVTDDRGQQVTAGAIVQPHHAIHHILHLLRLDWQAGGGGIGRADAGEQQPQIVVNLGHGANRGTRVFTGGFLFDRNGR